MRKSINEIINTEVEINNGDEIEGLDEVTKDPSRLEYRRKCLKSKLMDIQDTYMGRNRKFTGFVEDENGRLDEEKIASFIEEMISKSSSADSLSQEKRQIIEDLLYCAITGPSAMKSGFYIQCWHFCFEKSQTFKDIMDAARDSIFTAKDSISYMRDEVYAMCYPEYSWGLFNFMLHNYTCEDILRDIYTDEEYRAAAYEYADVTGIELEEVLKDWGLKPEISGDDSSVEETPDSTEVCASESEKQDEAEKPRKTGRISYAEPDEDFCDPDESESPYAWEEEYYYDPEAEEEARKFAEQEEEYYIGICSKSTKAWEAHLPNDNHMKERYIRLRKAVFTVDTSDIEAIVQDMVDSFLLSHGISPICTDRGFGVMDHELERCVNALNRNIKRIR